MPVSKQINAQRKIMDIFNNSHIYIKRELRCKRRHGGWTRRRFEAHRFTSRIVLICMSRDKEAEKERYGLFISDLIPVSGNGFEFIYSSANS